MYVVTWWNKMRQHRDFVTEGAARLFATNLRKASDGRGKTSLVPIRVLPQSVFQRMQELAQETDRDRYCRHRCLYRLCAVCVAAECDSAQETAHALE